MADSSGPEEDYAAIFSPGGSGSSIPPASPTDSSLGTPGDDPTGSPTTEVPTKPVGVVGKILSGPSGDWWFQLSLWMVGVMQQGSRQVILNL